MGQTGTLQGGAVFWVEGVKMFGLDFYQTLDIAVAVLTPLTILFASVWFSARAARQSEKNQKFSELVEKRVALWDKLAVPLNDIYTYFLFVGDWRALTERDMIAAKRNVDKIVFSYRPFFSLTFFDAHVAFMNAAFKIYGGQSGDDAKLRTVNIRPQDQDINPNRFTGEDNSTPIHDAYFHLLTVAAAEFDLVLDAPVAPQVPKKKTDIKI